MQEDRLIKELIKLQGRIKSINNLLLRLKREEESVYKKEEDINSLKKLLSDIDLNTLKDELLELVRLKEEEINIKKTKEKLNFGKELSELLLKQLNLKLSGNYPNLYAGIYHIRLEFEQGIASIFWGPELIKKTKPIPEEITNIIKANEDRLKSRKFNQEEFFNLLYQAYKRVILLEGGIGEKAPIMQVLKELVILKQDKNFIKEPSKNNFKEYKRIDFAWDLYCARKVFGNKIILYVATFDATRDKENALFVPDGETNGTRYAYICIRR